MRLWRRAELQRPSAAGGRLYEGLLRVEGMSIGLYSLAAGALDGQEPHTEDEVYAVLAGRARFSAGDETIDVAAGDTIFVPAGEEHRFHDIVEQLQLIVVFAPPEGSARNR